MATTDQVLETPEVPEVPEVLGGGPPPSIRTNQEVNQSILDYCSNQTDSSNPVCGSLALYTIVANYLKQNNFTPEQIALATTIFKQVVPNTTVPIVQLTDQADIGLIAVYVFIPIVLIGIVALWYMVVVGWLPLITAIYALVLLLIICYICFVALRITITRFEQAQLDNTNTIITTQQDSTISNIAYWPKGLLAIVYALQANTSPNINTTCSNTSPNINTTCSNGIPSYPVNGVPSYAVNGVTNGITSYPVNGVPSYPVNSVTNVNPTTNVADVVNSTKA